MKVIVKGMVVIKVLEVGGSGLKGINDKKIDWGYRDRMVVRES